MVMLTTHFWSGYSSLFFIKSECLNKYLKYNIGESTSLELHSEKALQSNSTKLFYF